MIREKSTVYKPRKHSFGVSFLFAHISHREATPKSFITVAIVLRIYPDKNALKSSVSLMHPGVKTAYFQPDEIAVLSSHDPMLFQPGGRFPAERIGV